VRRTGLISIVVLLTGLAAFAQRPTNNKTAVLRNRVPPSNPEKYRDIREAANWKNPFLIVQPNGVEILCGGAAASGPTIPVSHVVRYLERLPESAWPYGLVVVVIENGVSANKDDWSRTKHTWLKLRRRLKEARIPAELWPSA
jgi:hypothetical protein